MKALGQQRQHEPQRNEHKHVTAHDGYCDRPPPAGLRCIGHRSSDTGERHEIDRRAPYDNLILRRAQLETHRKRKEGDRRHGADVDRKHQVEARAPHSDSLRQAYDEHRYKRHARRQRHEPSIEHHIRLRPTPPPSLPPLSLYRHHQTRISHTTWCRLNAQAARGTHAASTRA